VNYRTLFRAVVLTSVALTIVAGWLVTATRHQLPSPLREYATSDLPLPGWLVAIGGLMVLLTIVTAVGLYRFWRPARWLYLASIALAYAVAPLAPPVVQTSLASAVQSLGAVLSGVMVGLMYFSAVAEEFRRGPKPNER
jgi:hypothetical protein